MGRRRVRGFRVVGNPSPPSPFCPLVTSLTCSAVATGYGGDKEYWAVPVSFNRVCDAHVGAGGRDNADNDFVVFELHSAHEVYVEVVEREIEWYRRVLVCQTIAEDDAAEARAPRGGLSAHLYTMSESAGVRLALINDTADRCLSMTVRMEKLE
jgi:hypothetical protein